MLLKFVKYRDRSKHLANKYVQYGCGFSGPKDWSNFDASPTLRFERIPLFGKLYTKNSQRFPRTVRYGDIVKGLPVPDGSCRGVYASHVLEHLSLEELDAALIETYRIMAPAAIFRLIVPDLQSICQHYLEATKASDPEACSEFMRQAHLGLRSRPRSLPQFIKAWLQNDKHLWMWDESGLKSRLDNAGFVDIRRATFNDSCDLMFSQVEDEDRFQDACAIEAMRPRY